MNILDKIKNFLSTIFKDQEQTIDDIDNDINEQKNKITNALTSLYFQQSKLAEKKALFESEAENLTLDLDLAIKNGRDDLSLHILEKIDSLKDQATFINQQLEQIISDIAVAEKSRNEIDESALKVKTSFESFKTRKSLLESQKLIKEQLGSINKINGENFTSKLTEKLHQLNAEIKTLDNQNPLDSDLNQLRKESLNTTRKNRLEELKRKHFNQEVVIVR